jgi:hypothetical protein
MSVDQEDKKRCAFCGEEILAVAIKCKHCQSMLTQPSSIARPVTVESVDRSDAPNAKLPGPGAGLSQPLPHVMYRSVPWFWAGALLGFLAFGYVAMGAIRHSSGSSPLEDLGAVTIRALLLGLAGNAVFGTVGALISAFAIQRATAGTEASARRTAEWTTAMVIAAVLTIPLGYIFVEFINGMIADSGAYIRDSTSLYVVAGMAMFGGAAAAVQMGRGPALPAAIHAPEALAGGTEGCAKCGKAIRAGSAVCPYCRAWL